MGGTALASQIFPDVLVMTANRARIPLTLTALCLLASCTSRTLPLPPPDVDPISQGPDANGLVTISGISQEGASVGVLNDATLEGVIVTTPDEGCGNACPFEAQVPAESGDSIRVWQFFETGSHAEAFVP
jgi:hypothetical protein